MSTKLPNDDDPCRPLDSLPNEILHAICEYAADGEPASLRGTVASLARSSKKLRAIARPMLHRHFLSPGSGADPVLWVSRMIRHHGDLARQLRTTRLDFVEEWCSATEADPWTEWPPVGPEREALLAALARAARERVPAMADAWNWEEQLRRGVPDAVFALMLALATELRCLNISVDWFQRRLDPDFVMHGGRRDQAPGPDEQNDMLVLQLIKHVAGVPAPLRRPRTTPNVPFPPQRPLGHLLKNLRSVTLRCSSDEGALDGDLAAPFFRLPSLRVFRAYAIETRYVALENDAGATAELLRRAFEDSELQERLRHLQQQEQPRGYLFPPCDDAIPHELEGHPLDDPINLFPAAAASYVEELELLGSSIWDVGIRVLTKTCRCLRTLTLHWGGLTTLDHGVFTCAEIAAAVERHAATLEELHLDPRDNSGYDRGDLDPGTLGSCLARLPRLTRLTVYYRLLWGDEDQASPAPAAAAADVLPPSLEELTLLDWRGAPEALLLDLIAQCCPSGGLPNLRTLDLVEEYRNSSSRSDPELAGVLEAAAAEVGLRLILRPSELIWRMTPKPPSRWEEDWWTKAAREDTQQ